MRVSIAVFLASAAVVSAQSTADESVAKNYGCSILNGAYCASGSGYSNIIIRCINGVPHQANCNDGYSGGGQAGALCYETSPQLGNAQCAAPTEAAVPPPVATVYNSVPIVPTLTVTNPITYTAPPVTVTASNPITYTPPPVTVSASNPITYSPPPVVSASNPITYITPTVSASVYNTLPTYTAPASSTLLTLSSYSNGYASASASVSAQSVHPYTGAASRPTAVAGMVVLVAAAALFQ